MIKQKRSKNARKDIKPIYYRGFKKDRKFRKRPGPTAGSVITELYNLKLELQEIQNYLAEFCVRYEITKSKVLSDMDKVQGYMNDAAAQLRTENKIPTSAKYEIEIPEEPESPGFMRKVAQS